MDDRMNLKKFLQMLRRRYKIIILTFLCMFLLTAVATLFVIKPTYEANSTILVGKLKKDEGQQGEINMLLASTMDLLKSPIVLNEVKTKLNITTDLEKEVSLQNNRNSQIISVVVRANDPQLAKEIAATISMTAVNFMQESFAVDDITVLNATELQAERVGSLALNLAIGFTLSVFFGIGMAVLREDLDDAFKDVREVVEILDLPVLGSIHLSQKRINPLIVDESKTIPSRKVAKGRNRGEVRV